MEKGEGGRMEKIRFWEKSCAWLWVLILQHNFIVALSKDLEASIVDSFAIEMLLELGLDEGFFFIKNHCLSEVMTNKKVAELDVEFIEYKGEAKASMDASIKAMKEEFDAKFEELKQLILGTSTHVDHVPQTTKVAAKAAPYVPSIR
ncbi:hypothetical protein Tco_1194596 [Tanacetum coccineum]